MSALIALRSYLYRYRVAMIGGFLFLICANLAALFLPYLVRLAIDSLQAGANGELLVRYAVLIIVAGAVQAVLAFCGRYFQAKASRQIEYELRANLFKHFEKLELDYFQHHKVGDLVARATNDLTAIRSMLGPGISNLMNTIVAFTVTITFMLTIDIQLTLYAAIILPMITVIFIVVGRQIEHRFKAVQDQFGEVSAHAQENLSGIRIIKAYRQEDHELEAFRAANQEYVRRSISYAKIYAILWSSMFFLAGIASVILLWRGGLDVIHGRISLGQLVQFMGYLAQLTWPMVAFGWVVNLFQQGSASMIRINEVMNHTPTIADTVKTGGKQTELILKGKVEFHHVTFSYGEHKVLHDINIVVEAGSSLAIVGPTGSGKSTLVNLVPRLFDVDQGQLLIDDIDVREIPLASLRHQIGFGVQSLSEQRMQDVMEFAQLGKDVNDFPQGTATMIGERGVTLSGGQKQRTALARAIAKDPAILILDDAMSSVDTHTEAEILGHLCHVMQGRTTIVISHRCSTVKNLDHIIVLDNGRIVEEGNHEKLLQEHGLYAEMYRRQLIGEELEESDNGDLFSGR